MLTDLDLNIAASTGIDDLNIADSAYDPKHETIWAVDTEYGLIKLDLKKKSFAGVPVERLEGGLISVAAAPDGGAYGLTQRDGCVVKFNADLEEQSTFTAKGAICIAAGDSGIAALYLQNGRIEAAKLDETGKEIWRASLREVSGYPLGFLGMRLFVRRNRVIVVLGDPKVEAISLDSAGTLDRRITIDLPGGTNGGAPIDGQAGGGRESYLLASTVDPRGDSMAVLYRSPARRDRPVVVVKSLVDTDPVSHAYAAPLSTPPGEQASIDVDDVKPKPNPKKVSLAGVDQFSGFDGDRLICVGRTHAGAHGRISTVAITDLEQILFDDIGRPPSKPRWWEKYRLKFNFDSGAHADEVTEELGKFGGQDIRY